jgi:hypothetical protein
MVGPEAFVKLPFPSKQFVPIDKEDQTLEDLFNHILWRAARGSQTPYRERLIKPVHDDDD